MRARSTIVVMLVAVSLLACGKKDESEAKARPKAGDPGKTTAPSQGCGAVPDDVAAWLTGLELGPVLSDEGSPEARRWAERQDVYETVLVGAGYGAWCRDAPRVSKACLTVSSTADPKCKDVQDALLALELAKDCPANLAAEAANWITTKELGAQPPADGQPRTDWEARSDAYLARVDKPTTEKLCADGGGIPLRCMTSREHPDCAKLLDGVTATLAPAAAP